MEDSSGTADASRQGWRGLACVGVLLVEAALLATAAAARLLLHQTKLLPPALHGVPLAPIAAAGPVVLLVPALAATVALVRASIAPEHAEIASPRLIHLLAGIFGISCGAYAAALHDVEISLFHAATGAAYFLFLPIGVIAVVLGAPALRAALVGVFVLCLGVEAGAQSALSVVHSRIAPWGDLTFVDVLAWLAASVFAWVVWRGARWMDGEVSPPPASGRLRADRVRGLSSAREGAPARAQRDP